MFQAYGEQKGGGKSNMDEVGENRRCKDGTWKKTSRRKKKGTNRGEARGGGVTRRVGKNSRKTREKCY